MDKLCRCFGLLLFIVTIHRGDTALLNTQSLQDELQKLADKALGVTEIQAHYDSLIYTSVAVDGPGMLKTITENLGRKFQGLYEAADSINTAVKNNHQSFPSTIPNNIQECCSATGVSDNLKFLSKVDISKACVTQADTSSTGKSFPDDSIEKVMNTNYEKNPSLLWQYFASEDGTSMFYPKVKVDDCRSYDPRYRPFYASSATPMPKDVVVVIDTSGSMETEMKGRSRISIAKEAATTVTNTLSANDRIGMVSFSMTAQTPSKYNGCYKDTLSLATTENKRNMATFINTLQTGGPSDFGKGLRAAFLYFRNSDLSINNEERTRVILFITDQTDYEGENPLHVIRDENKLLNNTVVIMTYGIGQKETDDSLLKKMSKQEENNSTYGTTKVGLTTYIDDPDSLRSQMGSYYSFFRIQTKDRIFTGPFVDTFSAIGLIISVCVPTYDISNLLGVACADMKLFDLFSEMNVFKEGEYSYAFIIDELGRTLKHPLLPLPRTIKENHPLIDIKFLERADGAAQIIDSMKNKQQGQAVIEGSSRTVARGVVIQEGIQTKTVKSTYYWNHIPNSEFSLCVVVGEGDTQQTLESQTPTDDVFLYHKRSLQKGHNVKDCKNFVRKATKDRATVQFNPSAFKDPSNLLYKHETESSVRNYQEYFTKEGASNLPGFKEPNVKNSVIASHVVERVWKQNTEMDTLVIWRYLGTRDGFIRVYPGVELTKDYDHELRAWWRRCIAQKGKLVLTTPYVDAWGAGYVLSLVKTIYKGKSGAHTTDDKVEAVAGVDVPLSFIHNLIIKSNAKCKEEGYVCMLIDVSGFIVIHPDFVSSHISNNDRHIETVHIVSKESGIANDLINENIMIKRSCTDFDNKKIQYTYKVELPKPIAKGVDKLESDAKYELRPVEGTNVFIVIKKTKFIQQCCKQLPMQSPDIYPCLGSPCECLCNKNMNINICTGSINLKDVEPTCIARTPDVAGTSPSENVSNLPACFDPKCAGHSSETDCYNFACSWCIGDGYTIFVAPCCSAKEVCEFGIVPNKGDNVCKVNTNEVTTTPSESPLTKQDDIILPVVGGILGGLVVILLIIILVLCRKYQKGLFAKKHNPQDDYLTPVPNPDQTGIDNIAVGHQPHSIDSLPRAPHSVGEVRYFTSMTTDSDNSIKSDDYLKVMDDDLKT